MSVAIITDERVDGFDANLVHRFLFSFSGMSSKMGMIPFSVSKWRPFEFLKLKYYIQNYRFLKDLFLYLIELKI